LLIYIINIYDLLELVILKLILLTYNILHLQASCF
jgi:hypothetical protein